MSAWSNTIPQPPSELDSIWDTGTTDPSPNDAAWGDINLYKGSQGDTGATGPQGPQGSQGITGETGPIGPTGPAATVEVGTVTTGATGSSVIITNVGTSNDAIFDFTIPRGATGPQGISITNTSYASGVLTLTLT